MFGEIVQYNNGDAHASGISKTKDSIHETEK